MQTTYWSRRVPVQVVNTKHPFATLKAKNWLRNTFVTLRKFQNRVPLISFFLVQFPSKFPTLSLAKIILLFRGLFHLCDVKFKWEITLNLVCLLKPFTELDFTILNCDFCWARLICRQIGFTIFFCLLHCQIDMVLDTLPKVAAEISNPLTQCNKVTVVASGNLFFFWCVFGRDCKVKGLETLEK